MVLCSIGVTTVVRSKGSKISMSFLFAIVCWCSFFNIRRKERILKINAYDNIIIEYDKCFQTTTPLGCCRIFWVKYRRRDDKTYCANVFIRRLNMPVGVWGCDLIVWKFVYVFFFQNFWYIFTFIYAQNGNLKN